MTFHCIIKDIFFSDKTANQKLLFMTVAILQKMNDTISFIYFIASKMVIVIMLRGCSMEADRVVFQETGAKENIAYLPFADVTMCSFSPIPPFELTLNLRLYSPR